MELVGAIQHYAWGKLGSDSLVAELMKGNEGHREIFEDKPYAELWMGDHPNGTCMLKKSLSPLNTILDEPLTYLFKVLSVRKALSIQVHPNKTQAEYLHKHQPDIYRDSNHKPEMVVALTQFTTLCGFRPYSEILNICEELPPLNNLLGGSNTTQHLSSNDKTVLRHIFARLMTADSQRVSVVIEEISTHFMTTLTKYKLAEIFNTLCSDYPGDVGVLCIFFLNVIELQPGECIYLPPNEIHSYIYGDCVECMACSDNVIRAGLTSKYKDVEQLLKIVNYTGEPAQSKYFQFTLMHENIRLFAPPVDDFILLHIEMSSSARDYIISVPSYPSILLVIEGARTLRLKNCPDIVIKRGTIILLPQSNVGEIEIANDQRSDEKFLAFIASKNVLGQK